MLVNSFTVTFGQTGGVIFTVIFISTPLDITKDGILEAASPQGSSGHRFLKRSTPTVGSMSQTVDGFTGGVHFNNTLDITTPTPGVTGVLGLGGLVATRRHLV